MSVDFVLSKLNTSVTMDVSGTFEAYTTPTLTYDATAIFYVKTSVMKTIFMYGTDDISVNDISSQDLRYYTFMSNWPYDLSLNPANAMMDQSLSENAMSSTDSYGTTYPANQMLVKHDFVRYLAYKLFNTVFGVDLFTNEEALITDIGTICNSDQSGRPFYQILYYLNNVCTTNPYSNANLTADASGYYYMTNTVSGTDNICRELMLQLFNNAPTRFDSISGNSYPQSLPFLDGDTINFELTINPAAGQELLTGVSSFGGRTYRIKIVFISDSSSYSNTSPVD